MRVICSLFTLLLVVTYPVLGKAVTIRVQDPNYSNITTSPSSFSFTVCPTASSPGGPYLDNNTVITADGCFGGLNQTGLTITSITLTFQNTSAVQNSTQPNAASSDIFQNSIFTAPANPNDPNAFYTFSFSAGEVTQRQTFVVTEDGVPAGDFPLVSLAFTTTSVTPEPPPVLLLGTSLMCMGWLYRRYRYA